LAARYSAWPLEHRLGTAVIASLAVHAAAMSLSLRAPRVSLFEPPAVLQLSLRELEVPPPAASPEPASLAPPAPLAAKRIKPEPRKHAPVPLARTSDPPAPSPAANVAEEQVRASAPEGDVASPAPPPQPAWPPLAAQVPAPRVPSSELLSSYGQTISQALARYKEYPRIAQLRGWEGAVTMRLRVAPSGRLIEAKVQISSGHEVLDKQALEMTARAGRLPALPDGLRDREEVAVLVPIVFRLER
jgi:protein TonB